MPDIYYDNVYLPTNLTLIANQLSCSFWYQPSADNGAYNIIASNYNAPASGFWISSNCEGNGLWFYNGKYLGTKAKLTNEVWYHCCFVFDNGIGKWYINGEEQELSKNSLTSSHLTINNLTIGNSYTGSTWDTTQAGIISDFRVYVTALTEEDIKELYQTTMTIDDNNNLYARELTNDVIEGISATRQGLLRAKHFNETSTAKFNKDKTVESNYFYEY